MPYCTQCAHAVPDASRFCPACGAPVAAPTVPGVSQAATRPAEARPPVSVTLSETATSVHGRFEPGTRLGSRYRIVGLLGRGGMGEVYRADDLELGQSVALKFLPEAVAGNTAELARFRGEVRLARAIAHPNVCRVFDIGEADGHVFLSMEYIDGEDLASVLRRMGRPTPDKALEIARAIGLGLAAAHEAGMLHRDLKPANIMIDGRGRARITDFGLAGLADDLAKGGEFAGTPAYMAPEQLSGGAVTVRSDVYAFGLVLYELFTGRRAFPAGNVAELKRMHDTGSVTSPSDFARDIDPAVERVIQHCLERDPELRPPSVYAVLGALPGGDPLAAALAAGETPSPELIANAGERGGMSAAWTLACGAIALGAIALTAGIVGPQFRPLAQPTPVLSVRAADVLSKSGAFGTLPAYSSEGFAQHELLLREARARRDSASADRSVFFWRRWSPRLIESPAIHREVAQVNEPAVLGAGEAAVFLDPTGRLIGLRAIPADSMPAAPAGVPDWGAAFAAAGLDPATFTPVPAPRPVPAFCDTVAAWTGPLPWQAGRTVTVQAGASRGRLTHFTMVHPWGPTTAAVDSLGADPVHEAQWLDLLMGGLLALGGSIYFAFRNQALGRGDWRGATRIAVFVFVMNILEALFATKLAEVGIVAAGLDGVNGRAFGHALMHAVGMWFAYMALEPYVRRLWPRMLVSWTRLVSGRVRDPLVGRDLLIGAVAGAFLFALGVLIDLASARLGFGGVPTYITGSMLETLTSLSNLGTGLSWCGSVCVLFVLESLVTVLLLRLLLRRTDLAIVVSLLTTMVPAAMRAAPDVGWPLALVGTLGAACSLLVLMRFGLLAGVATTFVALVLGTAVPSLDFNSWYADRALLPMLLLVAIVGFGAFTAMGGKSIFGDPLQDGRGR